MLGVFIAFLLTFQMFGLVVNTGQHSDISENEIINKGQVTAQNSTDVPTWSIGSSWSYHHNFWYNDSDSDNSTHIVENITYTVSDIQNYTCQGKTYYAYNLTLTGDVTGGSVAIVHEGTTYTGTIQGGSVSGYKICRVVDLGIVTEHQYRHITGTIGVFPFNAWSQTNISYKPVVENYDFPLKLDENFWGNTTMRTWGYQAYDISTLVNENTSFDSTNAISSQNNIAPSKQSLSLPAYTFNTYFLNSTNQGGNSDYINRWFNASVKSFVKEYADMPEEDWRKKLIDYNITANQNEAMVQPSEVNIYDSFNVSGTFPDCPNADISIRMPGQYDSSTVWSTTTDGSGNYNKTIQAPFALDHTPTNIDFSSVGIIVEVDASPQENYTVTTLILHLDKHRVSLHEGWNLISTNLELWDNSLQNILNIDTYGIKGEYSKVMYRNRKADDWMSYAPGRESRFNSLHDYNVTRGIWIKATSDTNLTFLGFEPGLTNITLEPGWNMVSFPSNTEKLANDTLPSEVTKVGIYNGSRQYDIEDVQNLDSLYLKPGEGYWVYNGASSSIEWSAIY